MNRLLRTLLALVLCLMLASASVALAEEESAPVYGGVLKIATSGGASSIGYPGTMLHASDTTLATPCVETLARYDDTGALVCWLAESYEEDPEACTLTVKVREGITFHDGTPFNAEAVKWNWEQFQAAGRNEISAITSIEVVDEYTVVAHMENWDNSIAEYAMYTGGWMVSPSYVEEVGADVAAVKPCGTGPFKFSEWIPDVKLVYTRNDSYWIEGQPYLDGVEYDYFADSNSADAALLAGEIDVLTTGSQNDVEVIENAGFTSIGLPQKTSSSFVCMFLDCTDEKDPLYDIRVRQALNYALDTEVLAYLMAPPSLATPVNQWAAYGGWSYNEEVVGYPRDVEKAKALLAEAGYPDGVTINLYYMANQGFDDACVAAQGMAAEAGIQIVLQPVETAEFSEMTGQSGTWDGIAFNAGRGEVDIAPVYARTFTDEGVRYVNGMLHPEDVVEMIGRVRSAQVFEEKVQYSKELSKMIVDDYCMIVPISISCFAAYAQDYVVDSHVCYYHGILWTPEACYIAK